MSNAQTPLTPAMFNVLLALAGELAAVCGWMLAAAFVPAFALACGVWSGSAKLFEVGYLFLWYIGPMHHLAEMDYTGVTTDRGPTLWLIYMGATIRFLVLAWLGRARQARG